MDVIDIVSFLDEEKTGYIILTLLALVELYTIFNVYQVHKAIKSHSSMERLGKSIGFVIGGILLGVGLTFIAETIWISFWIDTETQNSLLIAGFATYLLGWVFGLRMFTIQIIRLPKDRERAFIRFTFILLGIAVLAGLAIIIIFVLSNILVFGIEISLIAFSIVTLLATFAFIYYYVILGNEVQKNASKLVRARLQLVRYAILIQLTIPLAILVVIFVEVMYHLRGFLAELIAIGFFIAPTFVLTEAILMNVLHVPNWIRRRFNLTSKRFDNLRLTND